MLKVFEGFLYGFVGVCRSLNVFESVGRVFEVFECVRMFSNVFGRILRDLMDFEGF
jgi:hypothetical protein